MNNCVVCSCETNKYKCTSCSARYCSIDCYKQHKTQPCSPPVSNTDTPKKETENQQREYLFPTEDTVPRDKLSLLDNDEPLKNLLRNPHLRKLLAQIDEAKNPVQAMSEAMMIPLFVEFSDACLRVVEPEPVEGIPEG